MQYATGTNPVAVAVGDVNGDRVTDLMAAPFWPASKFTPGSLSLLLGKGDGTFGPASTLTAGSSPGDVGLGDFNGDGRLDLAVANGLNLEWAEVTTRSVIARLDLGNGTFGPEIPVATAQRAQCRPGINPSLIQGEDINQDNELHDIRRYSLTRRMVS